MNLAGIKELTIGSVKLRELSVSGVKLWQAGRLPAGYTELEYIETDGSSWIDTGVNASGYNDGIRYTLDVYFVKLLAQSNNNYCFGAFDGSVRAGGLTYYGTGSFRLLLGTTATISHSYDAVATGHRRYIEVFATSAKDNATMTVDGNAATKNKVASISTGNMPNANVYLGFSSGISATSSSKALVGKIYSFTMSKVDGTPIREFVPSIRKSDNTVGMFDIVTGRFYDNAGTGTMTAGPAV